MKEGRKQLVWRGLALAVMTALIALAYRESLAEMAKYAAANKLYSHFLLVPLVSAYLVYIRRSTVCPPPRMAPWPAALLAALAAAGLGVYAIARAQGVSLNENDHLCIMILSMLLFWLAGYVMVFGVAVLKAQSFAMSFLVFMVPLPSAVTAGINALLQHASVWMSYRLLSLSGTPVLREGLLFYLPGLTIEIAEACSGIRSSLVLLMAALLAGYIFLRSPWLRALLALAVFPIGVFRNSVRIVMIALLTIHVDPGIIKGPLHRQGGPPFFIFSLVILFAVLLIMRKAERSRSSGGKDAL